MRANDRGFEISNSLEQGRSRRFSNNSDPVPWSRFIVESPVNKNPRDNIPTFARKNKRNSFGVEYKSQLAENKLVLHMFYATCTCIVQLFVNFQQEKGESCKILVLII